MSENSPYGKCPICGANGVQREKRPNGDDMCERGHKYPSKDAVMPVDASKPLKMYILVKASLPSHKMVSIAHAVLIAHKVFNIMPSVAKEYDDWLNNSFRKVVCEVNDEDFERFKQFEHRIIATESAFENAETCMVFCPRKEWPKAFQFLSMSKY
jgi:hypothetical protein